VITLVDQPEGSAQPAISLVVAGGLAFLFGLIMTLGFVISAEYLGYERRLSPGSYDELRTLARGAWEEISPKRVAGGLRRLHGRIRSMVSSGKEET